MRGFSLTRPEGFEPPTFGSVAEIKRSSSAGAAKSKASVAVRSPHPDLRDRTDLGA